MIAAIVTCAAAILVGWPFARAVEPDRGACAGLSFLLGSGILSVLLAVLGFLPGGWSRAGLSTALLLVVVPGFALVRRVPADRVSAPWSFRSLVALAALVPVCGHAVFATAAPAFESDYIENWGLKGRLFFEAKGVDWSFLADRAMEYTHPDYPLLVPLLFDVHAIVAGVWDDRGLGLIFTAFGVAFLLIAQARLREDHSANETGAALGIVALAPLALLPWIGLADGPLAVYLAAGSLYLRDAIRSDARDAFFAGAVLFGLAALTKNEGIAAIAAMLIAVIFTSGRRARDVARLWPAAAIAALWIVPRLILDLETDVAGGDLIGRGLARAANPMALIAALWTYAAGRPLLWGGILLGIALGVRRFSKGDRLILAFVAAQVAAYVMAYLVSPHDLAWHVRWSWERLVSHVTLPLTFVAITAILAALDSARLAKPRTPAALPVSPQPNQ